MNHMLGYCELLSKWLNTHGKTIKIALLNGQSWERAPELDDPTNGTWGAVSFSCFPLKPHALLTCCHPDKTLAWPKAPPLWIPKYWPNACGIQEFCKICTWEMLFLKIGKCFLLYWYLLCDRSQNFSQWKGTMNERKNKAWIHTAGVYPLQSTSQMPWVWRDPLSPI